MSYKKNIVKVNFHYIDTFDHVGPAMISAMHDLMVGVFEHLYITYRRGTSQYFPFGIILCYIAKKSYFVVIGPIRNVDITCIFRPVFPFVVVSKIGISTIR